MEGDTSRKPFGFEMDVLNTTRRPITVNNRVMTALQLILTALFTNIEIFDIVVLLISSYFFFLLSFS